MYDKFLRAFRYVTREGLNYAVEQFKNYYPWLRTKKEEANDALEVIKKEAGPKITKTSDDLSKYVLKKYEAAKKLSKKAEKDRKKAKMNSIRNTIIATTLGFGAGAATGYLLVKKSQIKETDYVFKDDGVVDSTTFKEANNSSVSSGGGEIKMCTEFNDKYSISEDGINLIRK